MSAKLKNIKTLWPWLAFSLLLIAIPLWKWRTTPAPLPHLGHIPAFDLRDETAAVFPHSAMAGKLWVVNFIFTSCGSICPNLTQQMKRVETFIKTEHMDQVSLLSISVDPEHDTPERLQAYARRYEADAARWKFLTGDSKAVEMVVVQGFKMAMGKPETDPETNIMDIMHGDRFILIDKAGEIRGYYEMSGETTGPVGLAELEHDLRQLKDHER